MRRTVTVSLVVVGLALMLVGFLTAAPWGSSTVEDSNPVVMGAPLLFVLGIVSVVAAAVLYEVLPDKRR
jgi:hypothetical protein